MKSAIVTGATGFIGIALTKELVQNGIHVYALCRKGSKRRSRVEGLPDVEIIDVDFADLSKIDSIQGDVFYHVAWEGARNDFDEQYKNVGMAVDCVKLAARLGCRRFIGLGSQAEYGETKELITEETPLKPTTAYGACKVATYYLLTDLAKRLELEFVWARLFSVYGPNDNPNSLVPQLVEALEEKGEFTLETDGTHIWNYLHEEDVARALRLLGVIKKPCMVYNVAHSVSKPLKEYAEGFKTQVNPGATIHYGTEKCNIWLNVSAEKLWQKIGEKDVGRGLY